MELSGKCEFLKGVKESGLEKKYTFAIKEDSLNRKMKIYKAKNQSKNILALVN